MLASLNHPGIAHLYSFEETPGSPGSSGRHLLIMELADGQTLAERLFKGPLSLDQVLKTSVEIASALDAAHRAGIVHRDLKPGNVMLTKSGAKLLDFGLAKVAASPVQPSALTSQPTELPKNLTQKGTILGTVQYMSPEQLEGKEADPRSDIFAFGAVLYEMATGRKAFEAKSQASLIAAILSSDPPPISTIQPMAPPALDRVVKTCLAKDPDERWQSAGDIARELKWIAEGSAAGAAVLPTDARRQRRRERLAWAVAALAILLAARFRRCCAADRSRPRSPRASRSSRPPARAVMGFAVLSPDARRLLLLLRDDGGKNRLAVRSLDSLDVRVLAGTDDARGAFWSPDGREIAFFADGKLKRMSADGGPARAICESGGRGLGRMEPRGHDPLCEGVRPDRSTPSRRREGTPVAGHDARRGGGRCRTRTSPAFCPTAGTSCILARTPISRRRRSCSARSARRRRVRLFESDSSAVYAEPGYLLFGRDDAVLAWRFDPKSLQLVGEPRSRVRATSTGSSWTTSCSLSAAGNRVAYVSWSRAPAARLGRTGRGASSGASARSAATRTSGSRRTGGRSPSRSAIVPRRETGTSGSSTPRAGPAARITSEPHRRVQPRVVPGRRAGRLRLRPVRRLQSLRAAGGRRSREAPGPDRARTRRSRRSWPTAGTCS